MLNNFTEKNLRRLGKKHFAHPSCTTAGPVASPEALRY